MTGAGIRWPMSLPMEHRRAHRLRAALRQLKPGDGSAEARPDLISSLADLILDHPEAQLAQLTLNRRDRRNLRHVAAGAEGELRRRVLIVARKHIAAMRWRSVVGLLAWYPTDVELIKEVRRKYGRKPPTRRMPRWFDGLGRRGLALGDLVGGIAKATFKASVSPGSLVEHWQIPSPSKLKTAVEVALIDKATDDWLLEHADGFEAIAKSGSLEPEVADRLVLRMYPLWKGTTGEPQDLVDGSTMLRWLWLAHDALGGWPAERPYRWAKMPKDCLDLARWYGNTQNIQRFFHRLHGAADRRRYWMRWAHRMNRFEDYLDGKAFAARIGDVVVVEFLEPGNATWIYGHDAFDLISAVPITEAKQLKQHDAATEVLAHTRSWRYTFDDILTTLTGLSVYRLDQLPSAPSGEASP